MRAFMTVSRRLSTTTASNPNTNNSSNSENQSNLNTPTRTRPSPRPPLQPREQNAMVARVPPKASQPLSVKSGNANMPDKHNISRPFIPALSATAKQGNRTPLTPRVAAPTSTANVTPVARKGVRTERSENHGAQNSREDLSLPTTPYLNNNVTPRSGSRKTRVESPANTPAGTPTSHPNTEPPRLAQDTPLHAQALGIYEGEAPPRKGNVAFSSEISYHAPQPRTSGDAKFFFANEAKSGAAPAPRPALSKQTSSTFFYANGGSVPPPTKAPGSAVGSSVGEDSSQPKFLHANGTPNLNSSPSPHLPVARSTTSNSSRITSPRLPTSNPMSPLPYPRPNSPYRPNQHAPVTTLRSAPGRISPAPGRPAAGGRGNSGQNLAAGKRRSVDGTQRTLGHGRSESLGSIEAKTPPSRKISIGSSEIQGSTTPSGPALSPISLSASNELLEEESTDQDSGESQSPIKTGHSIEHMNELAANARRERKVLDLEITNSSLEAINRTLERQMRKQTAELRRYRRLSRTGRLSIATTASLRTSDGSISLDGAEGSQLSDMSDEDDEDLSDEEEFSEDETADESTLSPEAMAENDARYRRRDEKRLQIDLIKHQQLLTDSQKMNQSLKRCLGWTEELINEGKKALDYRVRVSDIELGGRVLAPDEIALRHQMDDQDEEAETLQSPLLREVMKAAAWGGFGRDDRDSGIEVDPETGLHRELQ
ncbi:hypothetical protein BP5796_03117 [Coleophoma crateriformis]|uniref:Uncharacterized protein n=1 Tax=Coleophoma crateriformis TaxID=565419 RepID=A0A3D8SM71_9HELO|nr:hypothetical protein BP5796_03117 [Coleophoma crateriformis]